MGKKHNNCVCKALIELKSQQDELSGCPTSCFSSLIAKLFKVDTLPFMLFSDDERPLELSAYEFNRTSNIAKPFHTSFFRIESINEDTCCATISLLRPIDIHGYIADNLCNVARLEKTKICKEIDLSCYCAVQCLDVDLMKKIEIEPKW